MLLSHRKSRSLQSNPADELPIVGNKDLRARLAPGGVRIDSVTDRSEFGPVSYYCKCQGGGEKASNQGRERRFKLAQ